MVLARARGSFPKVQRATWVTLSVFLLSSPSPSHSESRPNLPLDRAYTLRNSEPFVLERDFGRQFKGQVPLGFIYPRACDSIRKAEGSCAEPGHLVHRGADGGQSIGLAGIAGGEVRSAGTAVTIAEAGVVTSGHKGPASFQLDTRLFAESGGDEDRVPFDREEVDVQIDSTTGAISYDSYARYRGNLSFDSPVGRFTAARDAVHWGPGLFNNLTFHQDGVPFNQYSFTTGIGPLSVTTLYGDLAADDHYISTENLADKNLYAHRYELSLGKDVLLGASEQLILYKENKPYLFVPIFPLFVAKTFMYEHANNGNLSVDATYRRPGLGAVYSEFLLDDLESPTSMFTKDYRQNKWAWMAGVHGIRNVAGGTAGFILEYSRIQPWVYTHFQPNTSQSSNLGYPLGNQQGPNSQSVIGKVYMRFPRGLYASTTLSMLWKGRGEGSSVSDPFKDPFEPAGFLADGRDSRIRVNPFVSYRLGMMTLEAEAGRFKQTDWRARLVLSY
jgi:hypothetical protein